MANDLLWQEVSNLKLQIAELVRGHNTLAEQMAARVQALEADVKALKDEQPVMLQPAADAPRR